MITGGIDFSDWKLVLNEAVIDTQGTVVTPEVAINYGNLISVILDFIIIAFAIFCVIKAINRLHKKPEEDPRRGARSPGAQRRGEAAHRDP